MALQLHRTILLDIFSILVVLYCWLHNIILWRQFIGSINTYTRHREKFDQNSIRKLSNNYIHFKSALVNNEFIAPTYIHSFMKYPKKAFTVDYLQICLAPKGPFVNLSWRRQHRVIYQTMTDTPWQTISNPVNCFSQLSGFLWFLPPLYHMYHRKISIILDDKCGATI